MSSALATPPPPRLSRRALQRERSRSKARRRWRRLASVAPVSVAEPTRQPRAVWRVGAVIASLSLHIAVVWAFAGESNSRPAPPRPERIVMVSPPPPSVPEPRTDVPKDIPAPPAPQVKPRPKRKAKSEPTPAPAVASAPAAPPPVVGLSFQSTTTGGSGPSFAVGSTQMGRTAEQAETPTVAKAPASSGFNQKATVRPGRGGDLVLPKRLREVKPDYPSDLRALGVEANVVVRVGIDSRGSVTSVRLVQRADEESFNEAAKRAARREVFLPATLSGVATAYQLSFTYRFRLDT
ncbi:MAG: TonB family protein [Myxococcota bacterium]